MTDGLPLEALKDLLVLEYVVNDPRELLGNNSVSDCSIGTLQDLVVESPDLRVVPLSMDGRVGEGYPQVLVAFFISGLLPA